MILGACVGLLGGCLAQSMPVDPGAQGTDAGGGTAPTASGKSCDVLATFIVPRCTGCHRTGGHFPDLSLDALPSLKDAQSMSFGGVSILTPGDPEGSLLYRKVAGTQSPSEGLRMPPQGPAPDAVIEELFDWITEGAETDCNSGTSTTPMAPARHHPEDWAASQNHGTAMKLQQQDCRNCHGATLEGRLGPSCDSCHEAGWRTNCTYCHGGTDTMTGAPPRDLDDQTDATMISFKAHSAHVSNVNHPAYACSQCHLEPEDVLSVGHAFDDTPGAAEVDFSGGLSSAGQYDGAGRCSNLYCHGNGLQAGAYTHEDAKPGCDGCHPGQMNTRADWDRMSGAHSDHLREGLRCADCHQGTAQDDGRQIVDPDLHVNGQVDVRFSVSDMNRGGDGLCTGTCHMERHNRRDWFD